MTDLSARLREVIEERQLAATSLQRRAQEHDLARQEPRLLGRVIPGWYEWPEVERLAADAILAGERDLGVLERHQPTLPDGCEADCREWYPYPDPEHVGPPDDGEWRPQAWPCIETRELAQRYGIEVE